MSREVHVRFCEQRRGKFPPLTLLVDAFRYKEDAERFYREQLPERLAKFNLTLAPDKTRLLRFTRYEVHKSESFEFLGFEFRWGQNRHKRPQVKRRTVRKKLRAACREMQAWLKKNRTDAEVAKVQSEEPGAGKLHAGICAGGAPKGAFLPRW